MWPSPVQVDVSRAPDSLQRAFVQLINTLIPGFVLVAGVLCTRQGLAAEVFSANPPGVILRTLALLFFIFIVGWFLLFVIEAANRLLIPWSRKEAKKSIESGSNLPEWRAVATKFLGKDLAPVDTRGWQTWYLLLLTFTWRRRFRFSQPWDGFFVMQAVGVAAITAFAMASPRAHLLWIELAVGLVAVGIGVLWPLFLRTPTGPTELISAILEELKKQKPPSTQTDK